MNALFDIPPRWYVTAWSWVLEMMLLQFHCTKNDIFITFWIPLFSPTFSCSATVFYRYEIVAHLWPCVYGGKNVTACVQYFALIFFISTSNISPWFIPETKKCSYWTRYESNRSFNVDSWRNWMTPLVQGTDVLMGFDSSSAETGFDVEACLAAFGQPHFSVAVVCVFACVQVYVTRLLHSGTEFECTSRCWLCQ